MKTSSINPFEICDTEAMEIHIQKVIDEAPPFGSPENIAQLEVAHKAGERLAVLITLPSNTPTNGLTDIERHRMQSLNWFMQPKDARSSVQPGLVNSWNRARLPLSDDSTYHAINRLLDHEMQPKDWHSLLEKLEEVRDDIQGRANANADEWMRFRMVVIDLVIYAEQSSDFTFRRGVVELARRTEPVAPHAPE